MSLITIFYMNGYDFNDIREHTVEEVIEFLSMNQKFYLIFKLQVNFISLRNLSNKSIKGCPKCLQPEKTYYIFVFAMTHSVFAIKVYRAPFVVLHGDNISTSISMYMLNELLHTMKLSIKSLHHNANDMEVRIIYIAYTLLYVTQQVTER